jgi:putative FmdB family regulatory protein
MPIHEYQCNGCGISEDYLHPMDEDPENCRSCGSGDLTKTISSCNVKTGGYTCPTAKGPDPNGRLINVSDGTVSPARLKREVRMDLPDGSQDVMGVATKLDSGEEITFFQREFSPE